MSRTNHLWELFFSTIRLELNTAEGKAEGTAFIFEYETSDSLYPFLITARHLIEGASEGRMSFMQSAQRQPSLGRVYKLDVEQFEKLWSFHPSENIDVAVTPFIPFVKHIEGSGTQVHFQALSRDNVISEPLVKACDLADEVVYIGYPRGRWDSVNGLPVMRRGMIASSTAVMYQNARQFVIDGATACGSSGSPVFLATVDDNRIAPAWVGMLSAIRQQQDDEGVMVDCEDGDSGMGVVVHYDAIVETIAAYLKDKGFVA